MAVVPKLFFLVFLGFLASCVTSVLEALLRLEHHLATAKDAAESAVAKKNEGDDTTTQQERIQEVQQQTIRLTRKFFFRDWVVTLRLHFAYVCIVFCVLLAIVICVRLYYRTTCAHELVAEALNPVYSYLCSGRKGCLLTAC